MKARIVEIRRAELTEADFLALLREIDTEKLAFEPWELSLLAKCASRHPRFNVLIANGGGKYVGFGIGGELFGVGCVNHFAIVQSRTHQGLGTQAMEQMLQGMGDLDHVYLATTSGNDGANRFWARHDFRPRTPLLEMDIRDVDHRQEGDPEVIPIDQAVERIVTAAAASQRVAEHMLADLRAERGHMLPLYRGKELCGGLAVGGLGFRGYLRCLTPFEMPDEVSVEAAFRSAFDYYRRVGIFRIHCLPESARERELVDQRGYRYSERQEDHKVFCVQKGETTFVRRPT